MTPITILAAGTGGRPAVIGRSPGLRPGTKPVPAHDSSPNPAAPRDPALALTPPQATPRLPGYTSSATGGKMIRTGMASLLFVALTIGAGWAATPAKKSAAPKPA